MLLYHYTTIHAVMGIRSVNVLKTTPANKLGVPPWLSLTSDSEPEGHGLPDGRELTAHQAITVQHELLNGKPHCFNFTECRAVIDFDRNDTHLVLASLHHLDQELISLNIAAYNPVDVPLPEILAAKTARLILAGRLIPKSPTWWYYKSPVPLSKILRFEQKDTSGKYVVMP